LFGQWKSLFVLIHGGAKHSRRGLERPNVRSLPGATSVGLSAYR
jgi:hypothetical protein